MAKHPSTRRESPPPAPASAPPPEPAPEPTPEPTPEPVAAAPAEAPPPAEPVVAVLPDRPVILSANINHPPDIGGPIEVSDAEEPPSIDAASFTITLTITLDHDAERGARLTSDLQVDGSDHLVSAVHNNGETFRDLGSQFVQRVGWALRVPDVEPTALGWEEADAEAEA